jgi:hypothetical protein
MTILDEDSRILGPWSTEPSRIHIELQDGLDRNLTVEGRAEEARSLLRKVLELRSLSVSPDVRARIDRETDVARLESWLEAAVTAATIGDVFRDG